MSGPSAEEIGELQPVRISIRKVETGEVRTYESAEPEEGMHYQWTDGNYGCDCNRELFFERAGGREIDTERCTTGRFVVDSIVSIADGAVLYSERP